jgi:hypothetical protein
LKSSKRRALRNRLAQNIISSPPIEVTGSRIESPSKPVVSVPATQSAQKRLLDIKKLVPDLLKNVGFMILGAVIGVPITVPLAPWIARKLSKEPVANLDVRDIRLFKGCTLYTITVGTGQGAEIKTFEANLIFRAPIVSMAFVSGEYVDGEGALNQKASISAMPSCTVSTPGDEKLPDNVQASILGPDRNELMISGHDLTEHSMSTIVLAVFPDPGMKGATYNYSGRATYVAYGLELPTTINRVSDKSFFTPR